MGRDNHPRMRQKEKLERKKAQRASYDRILIVCEGKKTEPQYFEEIRKFYKLNSANIQIMPSADGTTPLQVVNYAYKELQKTLRWEKVFCVFDRDDHPHFDNALKRANALDKKFQNELDEDIRFTAIPSNPCFELWLLIHFICITKEIHRDKILHELRHTTRLPNYEKGQNGYFSYLHNKLPTAFDHAKQLTNQRARHSIENPYTAVGELVEHLIKLGQLH